MCALVRSLIREVRSCKQKGMAMAEQQQKIHDQLAATVESSRDTNSTQRTLSPCPHPSRCQGLGLLRESGQCEFHSVLRNSPFRMTVNKNNGRFHSDTYKKKPWRDTRGGPSWKVALKTEIRKRWEPNLGKEERQEWTWLAWGASESSYLLQSPKRETQLAGRHVYRAM